MNKAGLDDLLHRLDRVERENRRWRRMFPLLLAGTAAVVLMAQACAAGKVVEAEQFILRDSNGKHRAQLGVKADGLVGLVLFDQKGQSRAAVALEADGTPSLGLFEKDGKGGVLMGVIPRGGQLRAGPIAGADGTLGLVLYDQQWRLRARLIVGLDGTPSLTLHDRAGKVIWRTP